MCYIATIKRVGKESDPQIEEYIKRRLYVEASDNNQGFAIVHNPMEENIVKTLDIRKAYDEIGKADMSSLLVHFRLATTGSKTVENTHWFKDGNWYFMHNGTVTNYRMPLTGDDRTDSERFFNSLMREIGDKTDPKAVAEIVDQFQDEQFFYGRAILYQQETDQALYIGDWNNYLLNDKYLVISSSIVDFAEVNDWKNIHGLYFEQKLETKLDIKELDMEGIYLMTDVSKPTFKFSYLHKFSRIRMHSTQPTRLTAPNYSKGIDGDFYNDDDLPDWKGVR